MRGLALATLFLGLCIIHPDDSMAIAGIRLTVFLTALIVICLGA
jgi:hypothetical protein